MLKFFLTAFTLFIVIVLSAHVALTQTLQDDLGKFSRKLTGENNYDIDVRGLSSGPDSTKEKFWLFYDEKTVYIGSFTGDSIKFTMDQVKFFYEAPEETRIVSARFKFDDPSKVLILLSDGNIVIEQIHFDYIKGHYFYTRTYQQPNILFTNPLKIIGDAVYILASGKVYVSRDTAKTWAIDSANIGSQYVQDVTVDTNFYGWVITQNRELYYQHPDSNVWHKDTSFTTKGFPQAIFVDRKGRMFISSTSSAGRVLISTNGGSSWTNTSTGIEETIIRFGDDAFGNIYAVGQGSHVYRLSNLTPPWVSIGDSIAAQAYLPSNDKIINSISGNTALFAATRYGMFQSTDFGENWVPLPNTLQSQAHIFYTGVVKGGNYYFVSTNLGIYRVIAGDTSWEKVFPKQGFIWGVNNLSSDSAGNLYSNLPFKTGPSASIFYNVKSTDYGNTWIPDTAGQGALGINAGTKLMDLWVDKQGTQYLGDNGKFYAKKPGQSWKLDTSGLSMKSGQYVKAVSLNNKKGIIYLSRIVNNVTGISLILYSRAVGDSAWQVVNTGTIGTGDALLLSDHDGNIIMKTFTSPYKIWRYDGSTWTETPLPSGIGSSPFAQLLTIDKNGVLWGSFFAGGSNKGVYFSANNGTTWTYVGLNKVGINFLSAGGDTAFAVTFIDGIYGFTTASDTSKPSSVWNEKTQIAKSYELYQNYPNPFNPATTISFTLPVSGVTSLKVYDILGREVAMLLNEERKAGVHLVRFNASKLSTGVYIYTLRAGNYTASKKLLLMK